MKVVTEERGVHITLGGGEQVPGLDNLIWVLEEKGHKCKNKSTNYQAVLQLVVEKYKSLSLPNDLHCKMPTKITSGLIFF